MTANRLRAIARLPGTISLPVRWKHIFGNSNPVEFEIGPGNGAFLLAAASSRPSVNFYGVEWARSKATKLAERIRESGLANALVIHGDATCVIRSLVVDASVEAYHVYFPDPWPKRRHHRRRLFSHGPPRLPYNIVRTLRSGGHLHLASDLGDYLQAIVRTFISTGQLVLSPLPADPLPTNFSYKYQKEGRPIFRVSLRKP